MLETWEKFCGDTCAALGVGLSVVRLQLARVAGESPEAQARDARYAALEGAAAESGTGVIALAQHADDQAETVLLQLLRGAAARGLAAMPEWRCTGSGCCYWRPLLQTTREEIARYARRARPALGRGRKQRRYDHKRNFLRAQILPRLEEGFPGYRTSLGRAAAHAADAAQLLDQLADLDAAAAVENDRVSLAALRELGALRARNLLRRILARCGLAVPPGERLAEFVRQAFEAARDRHPALELERRHVLRADGGHVVVVCAASAEPFLVAWHGESVVALPHGSLLFGKTHGCRHPRCMVPACGLIIRPREGGERLKVAANRPARTLKNLMQEAGVPAASRSRWPLIVHEGHLVAIPGIGVGVEWQCPPNETGWGIEWRPVGSAPA